MYHKEPATEHTGDTLQYDLDLSQWHCTCPWPFPPPTLCPWPLALLPSIMLTTKYSSICTHKPMSNLVYTLQLPQMLLLDHSHLSPLSLYTANEYQKFTRNFNIYTCKNNAYTSCIVRDWNCFVSKIRQIPKLCFGMVFWM